MTIDFNFDGTIATNFGSNAAAFEAAFASAAAVYTSNFSDNIHVNINVTSVTGTGTLGASNTSIGSLSWSNLRNYFANDAKTANDLTAIGAGGSMTVADPSNGADTWWVTRAQEKALGIIGDDLSTDGTITIGSGFNYTYNDSGGVTSGTIDLQGVADHEISEIMGRIGLSGSSVNGNPSLTLLDAFSFTGANSRGMGNGAGNYFSINTGTTLLKAYNNQAGLGGDSRDWASGTNDSFNAFSSSGVVNPVTAMDLKELDVLGYDLVVTTPEPATGWLLIAGPALLFLRRRRR